MRLMAGKATSSATMRKIDSDEPEEAPEDRRNADRVADRRLDDEGVETHRRRQQADLEKLHDDNADPDEIEPRGLPYRQEHGYGEQKDANGIKEHA